MVRVPVQDNPRLLRDRGGEVIAYDQRPREQTWSVVLAGAPSSRCRIYCVSQIMNRFAGDESVLASHVDRTLLFVMPYRPSSFGKVLRAWRGPGFVVVTRSEFPFTINEGNPEGPADEAEAIEEGGWVRESERDLLPHGWSSPFGRSDPSKGCAG